jgi:hypothetical protein
MTAGVFGEAPEGLDPLGVEHVAPLVAYLASPASAAISGQVFVAYGPMVVLASAPGIEARFDAPGATWTAEDLAETLGKHFSERDPSRTFRADAFAKL